jgi:hypothetical protein
MSFSVRFGGGLAALLALAGLGGFRGHHGVLSRSPAAHGGVEIQPLGGPRLLPSGVSLQTHEGLEVGELLAGVRRDRVPREEAGGLVVALQAVLRALDGEPQGLRGLAPEGVRLEL